ncbi:hypothetical protein SKAU_G00119440 [Synaphobranchus kaupii]|uniref:BLUF domain-containing protein n=1 Tax=Synaphobranchus kaupii TaxID=118154 RepID=A0A9Q1FP13_SYNKA|nr:hypothetical protein SKAU_G00119440 [Synaphobranchus kaupii]
MASESKKPRATPFDMETSAFGERESLYRKLEDSRRAVRKFGRTVRHEKIRNNERRICERRHTASGAFECAVLVIRGNIAAPGGINRSVRYAVGTSEVNKAGGGPDPASMARKQVLITTRRTGMEFGNRDKKQKTSEDKVRTSLYHRRLARRMILAPQEELRFLLHRLILIGRISPELAAKRDLGAHYEKLSQHLQRRYQADAYTGLLLLYPSHVVHIVESSSEVLVYVLRDLWDMQSQPCSALILESRILVVSHDVQSRLFQDWSYKVLDLPAMTLTKRSKREPTEKLVTSSLKLILKLGSHLQKASKIQNMSVSAESLLQKVPELFVPQNVLAQLIERTELLTPQQYLKAYHTPIYTPITSGHTFGSVCPHAV